MNKLLKLCLLTMAMFGIVACDKGDGDGPEPDVIWDIYPTGIVIEILDEEGNDLLDPDVDGNWVGEEMFLSSADKVYPAEWGLDNSENKTRDYLPHFNGLVWGGMFKREETVTDPLYLYFGELAGDLDHDLSVAFTVPAIDKTFEFRFTHRFFWKNHLPKRENHIYYDGKDYEGTILTLVLPPKPASHTE